MVQQLLAYGARINLLDVLNGELPLHTVAQQGQEEAVRLFQAQGDEWIRSTNTAAPRYVTTAARSSYAVVANTIICKVVTPYGVTIDN